ncbi:MAG: hypothetical protein WD073_03285 [Xanthobacteraceae bacterium]
MARFAAVTDEDLARARQEPEFRRKLLADNLDVLLDTLNRLRNSSRVADPACARQIREGVELAVKLADLLQEPPKMSPSRAA